MNYKSSSSDTFIGSPKQEGKINLLNYRQAGIYQIRCIINNKVYVGESNNLLQRCESHFYKLEKKTSDITKLQKDFTQYGPENFTFEILYSGPKWSDNKKRKMQEKKILQQYAAILLYNKTNQTNEDKVSLNYRILNQINGVQYNSIEEAANALKMRPIEVANRLKNKYPGYIIIEKIVVGYTPVIINDEEFPSLQSVVQKGLAPSRSAVHYRLNSTSPKWAGWQYKYGKKQSGPDIQLKSE